MAAQPNELGIPRGAQRDHDAGEILRAWSVGGGLDVSLKPSFENPAVWGVLSADLARHAARAYAAEGRHREDVLGTIARLFEAELGYSTDLGTIDAVQ